MAQHHLHSAEARNFGPRHLERMSDCEIEMLFAECRWGTTTEQVCPQCTSVRKHYRREHRKQWRCADCNHEFSVTSGTPWHKRKLSLREILMLLMDFERSAKGLAALEGSRNGFTPKTVSAFAGKLREALIKTFDFSKLGGIVHLDGGHFCGKPRKPNRRYSASAGEIAVRFGRKPPPEGVKPWKSAGMTRANWERRKNRRVVIVLNSSAGRGNGSARSIPVVCSSENQDDAIALARQFIDPNAIVMTDESSAFSLLAAEFDHRAVAHAKEFCTEDGVSDNMSETFFSRMRRAEYGTFHGFRPKYIQDYAFEMAWRESNRKKSQRDRILDLMRRCLQSGLSDWWRGYWQGRNRNGELGIAYVMHRLEASASL